MQRLVLPLMTLPPVILVPGHKPSHEVKCLTVGKRDMSTPLRDHRQRGGHVDAVNTREVHAAHLEQLHAKIELGRVARAAALLALGRLAVMSLQALQLRFDLAVALG